MKKTLLIFGILVTGAHVLVGSEEPKDNNQLNNYSIESLYNFDACAFIQKYPLQCMVGAVGAGFLLRAKPIFTHALAVGAGGVGAALIIKDKRFSEGLEKSFRETKEQIKQQFNNFFGSSKK
jgi:hypothetical protein